MPRIEAKATSRMTDLDALRVELSGTKSPQAIRSIVSRALQSIEAEQLPDLARVLRRPGSSYHEKVLSRRLNLMASHRRHQTSRGQAAALSATLKDVFDKPEPNQFERLTFDTHKKRWLGYRVPQTKRRTSVAEQAAALMSEKSKKADLARPEEALIREVLPVFLRASKNQKLVSIADETAEMRKDIQSALDDARRYLLESEPEPL